MSIINIKLFNQEYIKHFECPLCYNLLEQPQSCILCNNACCKICLDQYVEIEDSNFYKCPICRQSTDKYYLPVPFFQKSPQIYYNILSELEIKCLNEGCNKMISYMEYRNHVKQECFYRLIRCSLCLEDIKEIDLLLHFDECDKFEIECTYCRRLIKNTEYDQHIEECEYKILKCLFCSKQMFRLHLPSHELNYHEKDFNKLNQQQIINQIQIQNQELKKEIQQKF